MPKYTESIHTLALVGHGSVGKTTLAEALLWKSGVIASPGTVEKGTTVCDFDPMEKAYGHSLGSSLVNFAWEDMRIHLIDTPGMPDVAASHRRRGRRVRPSSDQRAERSG